MRDTLLRLVLGVGTSLGVAIAVPARAEAPLHHAPAPAAPSTGGWQTHATEHFTILYAGEWCTAAYQGELLEEAHRRFHQAFDRAPFVLQVPREPLVALYFEDKADYLRYARHADRVDMSWTVAYYSAKTNRVAFFRYGQQATVPSGSGDSETTSALHQPAAADPGTVRPLDVQLSLASATHEAAHQLAFNTGLQQRGVIYPLWASEGLATSFELSAPGGEFGMDAPNPARSSRLERAWREGALRPLSDFITTTRVPTDDPRATDDLYAQAWGLFRYLYLHHREGLADYLAAMREAPKGHRSLDDLEDDFTAAFGPLATVERGWLEWVATQHLDTAP